MKTDWAKMYISLRKMPYYSVSIQIDGKINISSVGIFSGIETQINEIAFRSIFDEMYEYK
jgi:hypothetical protein